MNKPFRFNSKKWAAKEYISEIPEQLPHGKFLVHNCVTAQRKIGRDGFRAWLAEDVSRYIACNCGFGGIENSEHHAHYSTPDNANRPHWIELPTDEMMPAGFQAMVQAECYDPSDEIEAVIRRLLLWLEEDHYEDAVEWLDELLYIKELWIDDDEDVEFSRN